MKPFESCPVDTLRQVKGVFTDIDDTLTTNGRMPAEAYAAMESLQKSGIVVVPITGRPAGWCDAIARIWPVDGVVGENGAFYFRYDRENRRMVRYFADTDETRERNRKKLKAVASQILAEVSGASISADQAYRETDLAIDFCEDVPRLSDESVNKIVEIMQRAGVTAKVSSIHVNGWFGEYDKLTMTRIFVRDCLGIDLDSEETAFAFTGDSPNDGPMFVYFSNSVGVANVKDFGDRLSTPPMYVTKNRGGEGFSEVANALLAAAGQSSKASWSRS